MKNSLLICIVLLTSMLVAPSRISAQQASKIDTVRIKTSGECDMCKNKIEKEVGLMKGVKTATLDLSTQVLTVVYNNNKTTPDKIRTVISGLGYDADTVKANNRAQKKLPSCCQPGAGQKGKCDTIQK